MNNTEDIVLSDLLYYNKYKDVINKDKVTSLTLESIYNKYNISNEDSGYTFNIMFNNMKKLLELSIDRNKNKDTYIKRITKEKDIEKIYSSIEDKKTIIPKGYNNKKLINKLLEVFQYYFDDPEEAFKRSGRQLISLANLTKDVVKLNNSIIDSIEDIKKDPEKTLDTLFEDTISLLSNINKSFIKSSFRNGKLEASLFLNDKRIDLLLKNNKGVYETDYSIEDFGYNPTLKKTLSECGNILLFKELYDISNKAFELFNQTEADNIKLLEKYNKLIELDNHISLTKEVEHNYLILMYTISSIYKMFFYYIHDDIFSIIDLSRDMILAIKEK